MAFDGNTLMSFILALTALAAFLGNTLVLYVLVTRPSYLKHPYNIFTFSLALADVVTSIFLVFSRFLYIPPVPEGEIARNFYCRIIWSAVILFDLGYISVYTVLALAIERWLAVVKPMIYRSVKPCHAVRAAVFIWFWGACINASVIWRTHYNKAKQQCSWTTLRVANGELTWVELSLQTLVPIFAIIVVYGHILYVMKKLTTTNAARRLSTKRTTVVAMATCIALMVAVIPSRVTFCLSKITTFDASGLLHYCLLTLTFSNSSVNPIIYGIYSSQFRREYKIILQHVSGYFRLSRRSVVEPVQSMSLD